nr:MAG TPA: minor capsid protein [Caudoviricetes sp.]
MERLYGQVDWGDGEMITRTQLWEYSRWKDLEKELRQFATETPRIGVDKITGCLDRVFRETIGADVSRYTGENAGMFRVGTDPTAVINTAWSGECFSARLWKNTGVIAERIRSDMEDMLVSGRGMSDIKKRLMEDFSVSYNDAARLVDTETSYVMNNAAVQRYRSAGLRKVRWCIAPEDGRECEICKSRANKVWHIDTAPTMPAHPRCRCVWQGVVELPGEVVPCDGEGETAEEAAKAAQIRQIEAKQPKTVVNAPETWYNRTIAGKPEKERSYASALIRAKAESKIKGTLEKPKLPEYYNSIGFDADHVHGDRGRDISREEAMEYMREAIVQIVRNDGRYVNYYSEKGAAYVKPGKKAIRTAVRASDYKPDVQKMMDVMLKMKGK